MKLLLDNCVSVQAKALFPGHHVEHVLDRGWDTLSNGKLLAAAAGAGFDAMVTVDKNIRHQQNLAKLPIAIIELNVANNRFETLQRCAPHLVSALESVARFKFVSVDTQGRIEALAERSAQELSKQQVQHPRERERER